MPRFTAACTAATAANRRRTSDSAPNRYFPAQRCSRMSDASTDTVKSWPDYRAVWRWHFYAGLFCIPFVLILATSGSIYLFNPQIEAWNEREFDHLQLTGRPASIADQVRAALAALPDSSL